MTRRLLFLAFCLSLPLAAAAESMYQRSEKARVLYEKGEALEAAKIYREILKSGKEGEVKALILFNLGTSLLKGSAYSESVEVFYSGLPSAPQYLKPRMLYNLAQALYKTQRRDEALSSLRDAIMLNPGYEDAKLFYEWILLQKPPEQPPPEDDRQPPPPPPPPMLEELPPPPPDMLQDELDQNADPLMKPW